MKPLQWVALGYFIIAYHATVHGYDLVADPIGWAFVLIGLSTLSERIVTPSVRSTAWLAAVLSVPLWVPAIRSTLGAGDGALGWAASLPQLAFGGLLCLMMSRRARELGERNARLVLQVGVSSSVIVAALPVLVFGGGASALEPTAVALAALLDFYFVLTMFGFSGRSWAGRPEPEQAPHDDEVEGASGE